jgi:FKBP12-rapamycin complex-associated protein
MVSELDLIELHLGRNTGEFMMSRYREVADIVLRYLEHRDRLVRMSITSLLPRIAHFLRDRFVTNYLTVCLHCFIFSFNHCWSESLLKSCVLSGCNFLQICMNHILAVLQIPAERATGFTALGEMAGALDGELVHYLPRITSHLREAVCHRACLLMSVVTRDLVFCFITVSVQFEILWVSYQSDNEHSI